MKDLVVVIGLLISFALLLTAHVAIVYGLAQRSPRWRAPAAFFVTPLAPYWAWQEHMRLRVVVWLGAVALYVAASILARL